MSNWVEPEWLPRIPENDDGPFYCYVLWVKDTRQYYVGHTGDPEARIRRHFDQGVKTTSGYRLELLWISGPMAHRTDSRRFEAALKSYVKSGNKSEFERCTDLYFARGATLLEQRPARRAR